METALGQQIPRQPERVVEAGARQQLTTCVALYGRSKEVVSRNCQVAGERACTAGPSITANLLENRHSLRG